MTIARDRWQQNLKWSGDYYPEIAAELHARHPDVGADAPACQALGSALEACRAGCLTRNQHVLLGLGELIAYAECAGSFAARAAAAPRQGPSDKAGQRFDPAALAAGSRVFGREAAHEVAHDGLRWVFGAGAGTDMTPFVADLGLDAVNAAQAGVVADMDRVADALYGRA